MSMAEYEPASGYNLPPGCLDDDIDRAYGGERRHCAECWHCARSYALGCYVCELKLKDAVAELEGARRRSPRYILAAVEDAVVDESDCCADFEE